MPPIVYGTSDGRGAECCAFVRGPGLRQRKAGFQPGPCPQHVNVTVPPRCPACPSLWGHPGARPQAFLGASGSHWALSEEKEQTLTDLHIEFSFAFHAQALALTSSLLFFPT